MRRPQRPGGATPSPTRSTSAASPTATATASATCPGITARLPYLRDLGVDALWLTPFYTSPQHDHGYDVADYRDVDPLFGTLADFDALLATAHELGLKVIVDLVPNHTSSEHAWFQAALAREPGSPERARYLFRDGRGPDGDEPPNNWQSVFGGPAWTRVAGRPVVPPPLRQLPARPRLAQPRGRRQVRGRPALLAGPRRRRLPRRRRARPGQGGEPARPGRRRRGQRRHDRRRWSSALVQRRADVGPARGARGLPALAPGARRVRRRPDGRRRGLDPDAGVDGAVRAPRRAAAGVQLRLAARAAGRPRAFADGRSPARSTRSPTSARPPTWVLSNHDVVRHATRYGGGAVGLARARAATLDDAGAARARPTSTRARSSACEQVDVAPEHRAGPGLAAHRRATGRDGCRVPMPWSGDAPPYGFGPGPASPGCRSRSTGRPLGRGAGAGPRTSTLAFYRRALAARREHALRPGDNVELLDRRRRRAAFCAAAA